MASEFHRTHVLCCERFAEPFAWLVEEVGAETETAIVTVDGDELETEPDGGACRRTWRGVREQFERVPDSDRNGHTTWRCSTTTDAGRQALFALIGLTDGAAGAYFVREVELRRTGRRVLFGVPHHLDVAVDATVCGSRLERDEIVDVPGEVACLVPAGTTEEWIGDDRQWGLAGGSLCVEALDGQRTSCYGLRNLQRASVTADGTLELDWDAGTIGDGPIGRALTWVMNRFYTPPTSVPCPDHEQAIDARTHMQEILDAYDGRTL